MIVLPMTPAPTTGGAPATADGTDPALAAEFASLVAAMLNPQLAAFATTDPAAAQAGAATTDGAAIASIASPAMTQVATSLVSLATPQAAGNEAIDTIVATPVETGDALVSLTGNAPVLSASPLASPLTGTAADVDLTAVGEIAVTAVEADAPALPVTGPALSAAAVINARQPSTAKVDTAPVETASVVVDNAAPVAAATATATAGPAVQSEVEEVEEVNGVDVTTAHAAVDGMAHRTTGTNDVAATNKTTAAAAPAAVEPHKQIASIVSPLIRRGNGSYRLSLHLKPEHLGNVDLHVDLHNGTIDLHMRTQHEQARDLLLEHIDDLKAELEHAGLRAGSFDIGADDEQRQPQNGTQASRPAFTATVDEPVEVALIPQPLPSSDSAIDVRA